ncbi:MAG: hypothetical protein RLZZ210_357 [Pseudomonadota bacterium]
MKMKMMNKNKEENFNQELNSTPKDMIQRLDNLLSIKSENQTILYEKDNNVDMNINIISDKIYYLSFKPSIGSFPYFKNEKSNICDYILFVEYKDYFISLLIELKNGNKFKKAKCQLQDTKILTDLFISFANRYVDKSKLVFEYILAKIYISEYEINQNQEILDNNYIKYHENNEIISLLFPDDTFPLKKVLKFILNNKQNHLHKLPT